MSIFSKFFRRDDLLCETDLVKPYCRKAKEALMRDDLPRAIAYLERGIHLAPNVLDLYLQRAQIRQYGMDDCAGALRDYKYILRALERTPDPDLEHKCRQGMKDMMATAGAAS